MCIKEAPIHGYMKRIQKHIFVEKALTNNICIYKLVF